MYVKGTFKLLGFEAGIDLLLGRRRLSLLLSERRGCNEGPAESSAEILCTWHGRGRRRSRWRHGGHIERHAVPRSIPSVPRLCDDGLKALEVLVSHVQGAQKVRLEHRRTREGEQERARKRLASQRLALRKWGLVHRVRGLWVRMRRHFVWKYL